MKNTQEYLNKHLVKQSLCIDAAPVKVYSGSVAILLDFSSYNSRTTSNSSYTARTFYVTVSSSQMSIQYVVGDVNEYLIRGLKPYTAHDISVVVYENSAYKETIEQRIQRNDTSASSMSWKIAFRVSLN